MEQAVLNQPSAAPSKGARAAGLSDAQLYRLIGAAAVVLALFVWVFWDFFIRQVQWAINQQADWGHTLVIPFIAGYFVYLRREQLLSKLFRTTWIGLAPIVIGIAWYMVCMFGPQPLWHHNLRGAGVALSLFGLVLLFTGWRATWLLLFPMAYLVVFGQTISHVLLARVTERMQDITAIGSEQFLRLLSMDVGRTGNTLYVFDAAKGAEIPLNIAEACSGMRMLMAFLALGVAMAYVGLRSPWQRIALVLTAFPTAIIVNIFRVATLAFLSLRDVNFTAGDFHHFVGLVWLIPAFLLFLGAMWLIRNLTVERTDAAEAGPASRAGKDLDPGVGAGGTGV